MKRLSNILLNHTLELGDILDLPSSAAQNPPTETKVTNTRPGDRGSDVGVQATTSKNWRWKHYCGAEDQSEEPQVQPQAFHTTYQ